MSILWMGPAMSDPGDIFSISAPSLGSAPPLAASTRLGDSSVSATGAFTYSYPIKVPPGRNGMQPDLALAYSSQGSIYGGIAAGWSLAGIPIISLDTSNGRLGSSEKRFNSSMAGDRPLIPVNDGFTHVTFRAQNDNSWTRYEKMAGTSSGYPWRAKTTDGTLFIFGDADHVTRCPTVGEEYAPLTRRIDKFGNQIDYYYTAGLNLDCHIDSITWGQHANPNTGLQTFAKVQFTYAHNGQCGSGWGAQIGSQISFRSGNQITTGSMKLLSITATASPPGSPGSPEHTRVITLDYDTDAESCTVTCLLSVDQQFRGTCPLAG